MSETKRPVRGVVVQCRLSSSRLPGKALYPLGGKPLVQWTLEAMKKVPADFYILATDKESYSKLKPVCDEAGYECFEGPLEDVLERFCMVIRKYNLDTVVRATGDNPFLFYEAAVESAEEFDSFRGTEKECDYLTWSGLPHGSGVEIFDGNALLKAAGMTDDPYDHEHAGPALYRHTDHFHCVFEKAPDRFYAPDLRTTVDTYGDYLRAGAIYNGLSSLKKNFEADLLCTVDEIMEVTKIPSVRKPVILVPCMKKGHGTGHLVRCLKQAKETGAFIYISESSPLVDDALEKGLKKNLVLSRLPEEGFDCTYVVDPFEMSKEDACFFGKSTLITIDDGSPYRDNADYVLEIIPSLKTDYKVNKRNTGFLDLPNIKRPKVLSSDEIRKILVCFGGEDPANLAVPVAEKLKKVFPLGKEIVVITRNRPQTEVFGSIDCVSPECETRIVYIPYLHNLSEGLVNFDLVFTHYGLTAFESLTSGCGVVLLPTTPLHKKLAEKYIFANCNVKKLNKDFIEENLKNKKIYNESFLGAMDRSVKYSSFIDQLVSGKQYHCPVCGKLENEKQGKIVSRNETRTYRRCPSCGMVYISFSCVPETKYEKEYFFESYKNQYGKTYKEDFENIKASCVKRVSEINKILPPEKDSSVLDIGCAYGPFLKAASENGWNVYGTDICDDAVESVKKDLGFKACVSAFPEIDTKKELGKESFDAVTMWYVIEHFQDLKSVLEKVSSLVKQGGVFAFSTPSGEGVSAKTDKDHFYTISPTDHFSVWEPSRADAILRKFGFKVIKTVSTGHHPERFPEIKKNGAKPGSREWEKVMHRSVKKNLGDTVEVYCVKIR
ncbi:MAG: methyltransferase domain-containing protein [Treponema sp.]|nr:methyltransferase domain-containing protein [Treponema sp.]